MATCVVLLAPGSVGAVGPHAPTHMPNLIGHSRVQVYRIMRRDGLYFQTRGPGSANDRWAAVTAQSPRPGTLMAWHAQATLTVTNRSARAARAVPRLIGLSRAGVYAATRHAELFFRTVGPGSSNGTWTVALGQSPAPGTRVKWHDEITIRVGTHRPAAPVPRKAPVRATAVAINGTSFKVGVATWYNYVPGRCATWYLPKGTRITVTDLATGKSITCVITDREVHGANRVVDLNETDFAQLAPLSQGVISVKVSW